MQPRNWTVILRDLDHFYLDMFYQLDPAELDKIEDLWKRFAKIHEAIQNKDPLGLDSDAIKTRLDNFSLYCSQLFPSKKSEIKTIVDNFNLPMTEDNPQLAAQIVRDIRAAQVELEKEKGKGYWQVRPHVAIPLMEFLTEVDTYFKEISTDSKKLTKRYSIYEGIQEAFKQNDWTKIDAITAEAFTEIRGAGGKRRLANIIDRLAALRMRDIQVEMAAVLHMYNANKEAQFKLDFEKLKITESLTKYAASRNTFLREKKKSINPDLTFLKLDIANPLLGVLQTKPFSVDRLARAVAIADYNHQASLKGQTGTAGELGKAIDALKNLLKRDYPALYAREEAEAPENAKRKKVGEELKEMKEEKEEKKDSQERKSV